MRTWFNRVSLREWLLIALVILLSTALLLRGDGIRAGASDAPQPPTLTTIRVGGAPGIELLLPTLVALRAGYFEQQGLSVEEIVQGSGANIRTALLAGDLDFALSAFVHVPLARANGQPLKIISGIYDREVFSLLVRSPLRPQVRTLTDLRGRRIGVASLGAGNWAALVSYLSRAGLDPNRDVEIIAVGNELQTVLAALRTGRIDAYPTFEPQTTLLLENGTAYPLIRIWEDSVHAQYVGERAMAMVVAVHENSIARNPELIQKFVNAQKLGLLYIRTHTADQIVDLLFVDQRTRNYLGEVDRVTLVEVLRKIGRHFGTGALSESGYTTELELAVRSGAIPRAVPFAQAIDWTYAGLANE